MTYYVFMNENIRSRATRKKPCMVVYDGKRSVTCSGVRVLGAVVRQSIDPCPYISTYNVHAWIEFRDDVGATVKIGRQWLPLAEALAA